MASPHHALREAGWKLNGTCTGHLSWDAEVNVITLLAADAVNVHIGSL